ncbi:hypothetical protein A1355_05390 [Methylomonas koyamae]|uniref:SCP2 domain-containing protein n=2 Tax=Methylococcaceae TaxID=403 RepID=A0A177NLD8_9GAMM|nr:hypothetical protein A1355_05390 [Methylomonas koyamae]
MTTYFSLGKLKNIRDEQSRERLAIHETRSVIDNLLGRYAAGKGKTRWCEKSTVNVNYIYNLAKIFPDAKYIILTRNCLDVVHSCLKISALGYMPELTGYIRKHPTNFVAAMVENWLDKTVKILEFEKDSPERTFRISYETLVQNPQAVLGELFDFLDEDLGGDLIKSVFSVSHDFGNGDPKVWFSKDIHADSVGGGRTIPVASIPEYFVPRIDSVHSELGYPSVSDFYAATSEEDNVNNFDLALNDFFNEIRLQRIFSNVTNSDRVRGICKIQITGDKGGVWIIESNSNGVRFLDNTVECDCVISTTRKVFYEIINGSKNAIDAYEAGEIWGGGKINLALEFGKFLFKP